MEEKKFLNYEGLSLYDECIKEFIRKNDIDLVNINLTENNILELFYKKDDEVKVLPVDLSSLSTFTEWSEL